MQKTLFSKQNLTTSLLKLKKILKRGYEIFIKFPVYILTHPIDGFYEMKEGKQGLQKVATTFIIIHAVLGIIEFAYTGFLFNLTNPTQFSMLKAIIIALLPYFVFMVANWSITSLMDGKGKFKEIYMVVGYAFFPSIMLRVISIFGSNFFTVEEGFFYFGVITFGLILTFYMIFMGIRSIHEYSILRTITTIGLTFVSMAVILFMGLLAVNLLQQILLFIQTILKELTLRL